MAGDLIVGYCPAAELHQVHSEKCRVQSDDRWGFHLGLILLAYSPPLLARSIWAQVADGIDQQNLALA
jgi:hypothetical protein